MLRATSPAKSQRVARNPETRMGHPVCEAVLPLTLTASGSLCAQAPQLLVPAAVAPSNSPQLRWRHHDVGGAEVEVAIL